MTDDAHDRCTCGHGRQKHLYGGHCRVIAPAYGLPYTCGCYRFEARPPVWRVSCESLDVGWFGPPLRIWHVSDPSGVPICMANDQPTAFRIAVALADREAELAESMQRHPAGRKLSREAFEAMIEWPRFRPMFPDAAQIIADARARLRTMPTPPNPLLDPPHGTLIFDPPQDRGPHYGLDALFSFGDPTRPRGGVSTGDTPDTIADKADHYRER